MKLPEDQTRLKGLLQETITLLCKNGLNYRAEFSVEALIVVTLDREQMFHANIKETVAKEGVDLSLEFVDSDSEKEVSSTIVKRGKTGKRRRQQQRDDSPEVPEKRTSSRDYGDNSQAGDGEDPRSDPDQQVKDENDENSSECLIVKDEQGNRSQNPMPVADLELVDGGEKGSVDYGSGMWNVQGASNVSAEGDRSQQVCSNNIYNFVCVVTVI